MNFRPDDLLQIRGENFKILHINVQQVLLQHQSTQSQELCPTHDLLQYWADGEVQRYDQHGRLDDPAGLTAAQSRLIAYRLPYALRFFKGTGGIDRHAAISEIAVAHGHTRKLPGISTCYRWASLYREFGRMGLRNGRR